MFFAEEIIQQKSTQLSGISLIIDFKGLSFAHLRTLTLKEIRRVVNGLQDGFPTKISGVHFVNYPTIFWSTFYLAQKFMKEKLRKRIHFHSTMETLHEFYDVNILPKTLDGELEQDQLMDKEILDKVLRENRELIGKPYAIYRCVFYKQWATGYCLRILESRFPGLWTLIEILVSWPTGFKNLEFLDVELDLF